MKRLCVYSVDGCQAADLMIRAAQKSGPNLRIASFIKTIEAIGTKESGFFGSPAFRFTPTQRMGSAQSHLAQIQDGRWRCPIDDGQAPPPTHQ